MTGVKRPSHPEARILIIDDHDDIVHLLDRLLRGAGYENLAATSDPREGVRLFDEFQPDVVLLDLVMPGLDGFGVMKLLRPRMAPDLEVPIMALTAHDEPDTLHRALGEGASDFITKPFDPVEVLLRVANLLAIRFSKRDLEAKVRKRTYELEAAQVEVLDRLARAAEYRDDDTGEHTQRVGKVAAAVGGAIGLERARVDLLRRAAPLHDVGKMGVPDSILLKRRKLTRKEFDLIKKHTTIGAAILAGSRFETLQMAEEIARSHHERWDGKGYPDGLGAERIPVAARITSIADVFDALTHERPYKEAWPIPRAVEEIRLQRGQQFDPDVVDAFLELVLAGRLDEPEKA